MMNQPVYMVTDNTIANHQQYIRTASDQSPAAATASQNSASNQLILPQHHLQHFYTINPQLPNNSTPNQMVTLNSQPVKSTNSQPSMMTNPVFQKYIVQPGVNQSVFPHNQQLLVGQTNVPQSPQITWSVPAMYDQVNSNQIYYKSTSYISTNPYGNVQAGVPRSELPQQDQQYSYQVLPVMTADEPSPTVSLKTSQQPIFTSSIASNPHMSFINELQSNYNGNMPIQQNTTSTNGIQQNATSTNGMAINHSNSMTNVSGPPINLSMNSSTIPVHMKVENPDGTYQFVPCLLYYPSTGKNISNPMELMNCNF